MRQVGTSSAWELCPFLCYGTYRTSPLVLFAARESAGVATPSPLEDEVLRLFDELSDPLLRYLLFVRLPVDAAEEIVQETFVRLFEHLLKGRARENLRGWVFKVAHNLALKQANATRTAPLSVEDLSMGTKALFDPAPHPEPNPVIPKHHRRLLPAI